MLRKNLGRGALLIAVLLGLANPAFGREEILDYLSNISIAADRTMTVRETITVRAEGQQIKRGIYRDFPTDYRDQNGNRYRVKFDVNSVKKDDLNEPFKTERLGNGVRVYIGNPNVILTPGTYRYEIEYITDRQLGFFESHDELYWNVTGNQWAFPITKARATVTLPSYVEPEKLRTEAYTGAQGSKLGNYTAFIDDLGVAHFETATPLAAQEGLTIVVSWPKGIISEPSTQERLTATLKDNTHLIAALIGSLLLSCYYLLTWHKVGRDPQQGVIVAEYEPPAGYSPASMRFIEKMGYDTKCFAAAVINLAVKGWLKIHESGNTYRLEKTGQEVELAPGEKTLAEALFRHGDSIDLRQSNHSIIGHSLAQHEQALSADYENKYFKTNRTFFFIGIGISIVIVAVSAILGSQNSALSETLFFSVWSAIWWFATGGALIKSWGSFRHAHGLAAKLFALLRSVFVIPFVIVGIVVLFEFGNLVSWSAVLFVLFIVTLNIIFYQLLKAPTLLGRKLLDKVAGFRHYVDIAEKLELDYRNPAGRTPELFERYLPYALALGIEQQWSDQFHDVFANAAAGEAAYSPGWYHGSNWRVDRAAHFSSTLGSSLTSAISSSSTAPGSRSGSGGGGSSGGGGGGGGGGGW